MKKNKKFRIGDWIRITRGEWKGKSTTITGKDGDLCFGYYCGKMMAFNVRDIKPY
jgi:hypothetical protein